MPALIMALLRAYAIAKVAKLIFTLALIAWFFRWIAIPEAMLNFQWPLKEFLAPLFYALGIKTAFAMVSTAYTTRWTYDAFRLALK